MEEDRISRLPEDVLRRIVSFLPTKSAVATSILARPWKNLYTSNPNLDFADNRSVPEALFVELVTKLLRSNTSPSIHSLQLSFQETHGESTINNWISAALSRNLRKLSMFFFNFGCRFTFDLSQFCCSTLKTLQVLEFIRGELPEIPESVVLPGLRVIILDDVFVGGMSPDTGSALASYFRSCPLLEEFSVHACVLHGQVQVCHALLRKVSIDSCFGRCDLVFNSPNLQHLEFYGYGENSGNCIVKNPHSLVTAGFTFPRGRSPSFISEMYNVSSLHLSMSTLRLLYTSNRPLVAFQNVTLLELDALDPWGRRCFFKHLLDAFPRLEVLVFLEGCSDYNENYELCFPDVKPTCLSRTFRELGFGTFRARKCEMDIVKYFLANGDVLNEVMLGSGVYLLPPFRFTIMKWRAWWEDPEMDPLCVSRTSEALAGLPKVSKTCQIVLSWIKSGKLCRRNINEFPHCQATFSEL